MTQPIYSIGIDSGSAYCKAVLMDGDKLLDTHLIKTGWDSLRSAQESRDTLLRRHGLDAGYVPVTATGYGRGAIDFAVASATEITCHARGAQLLRGDIQGVVDIGGQDSKVIKLRDGRVADFLMNDKCAAGTGRFLNMATEALGIPFEDIDTMTSPVGVPITSMCTVFAESEIIGLMAARTDRTQIMRGVLASIASKIRQQAGRLDLAPDRPVLLTGGLSGLKTLVAALQEALGVPVATDRLAPYAGAIGAALCAGNNK